MAVTYEFRCEAHGRFEEHRAMGQIEPALCPDCGGLSAKLISLPNFQEDRSRMWRGANGSRYSSALGCELPESRRDIERLAKEGGVELDAHELPHVKRAVEAGRALKAGELRESREVYAHIAEPRPDPIPLTETLRKSGKMRAVAERVAVGFEHWSDRGVDSASAMAARGAQALSEGPAVLNTPERPVNTT